MLTVKALRDVLVAVSPQAAIEHCVRVIEKHGEGSDFENPRVQLTMKSGAQFMGYLIGISSNPSSKEKFAMMSLVLKHETDQARDVAYFNIADVEMAVFYDIDPVVEFMPRK